jgi:hypothetical protein
VRRFIGRPNKNGVSIDPARPTVPIPEEPDQGSERSDACLVDSGFSRRVPIAVLYPSLLINDEEILRTEGALRGSAGRNRDAKGLARLNRAKVSTGPEHPAAAIEVSAGEC